MANSGHVPNSHRAALEVGAVTVVGPDGNPSASGSPRSSPAARPPRPESPVGEIITAVNGTPTPTTAQLSQVLAGLTPGQSVPVTVRNEQGASRQVQVTLGQLPGS